MTQESRGSPDKLGGNQNGIWSHCCSVIKSCLTLCDPMDWSMSGLPVPHCLPVCPGSCPLSQWCYPTISSSAALLFCLQSFPASGSFSMSWLFTSGGQRELELQHQSFQCVFRVDFLQDLTWYINTYIWNLEKWYWWAYFQGRHRDADIENRLVDTVGEGDSGANWQSSTEIYNTTMCKTDS